jgi:hypothetical protein
MAGWADNNVAIASSLFFIVDLEEEGVLILPIPYFFPNPASTYFRNN